MAEEEWKQKILRILKGFEIFGGDNELVKITPFKGTRYSLNRDDDARIEIPPPRVYEIRFWRNGYTINGGNLRPYNAEDNAIIALQNARCPPELEVEDDRTYVDVNLIMKWEDYEEEYTGPGRVIYRGDRNIMNEPAEPQFPGVGKTLGHSADP